MVLSPGTDFAGMEISDGHLGVIVKFLGISNYETIFVEGIKADPDLATTIKEKAIKKAKDVANRF
jgi:FMN-dependent NADH-azoreductase